MLSPQRWQSPLSLEIAYVKKKPPPVSLLFLRRSRRLRVAPRERFCFPSWTLLVRTRSVVYEIFQAAWAAMSVLCLHTYAHHTHIHTHTHTHTHIPHIINDWHAKESQVPIFQWLKINNLDISCCLNSLLFRVKCEQIKRKSHRKPYNQKRILAFLLHFLKTKIFKKYKYTDINLFIHIFIKGRWKIF